MRLNLAGHAWRSGKKNCYRMESKRKKTKRTFQTRMEWKDGADKDLEEPEIENGG